MSIPPERIEVGQCYLTRSGQVRRVRAFHEGRVQFEARSKPPRPSSRWVWRPGILDPETFAAMIERPVPCDWTPESDEA
jgi:hypothetical protein